MADQLCLLSTKLVINIFLLVAILLVFLNRADAKIVKGVIHTSSEDGSNWEFITRFCFLSRTGRLEFEFSYPQRYDGGYNAAQNILLYHDIQWPSAYPRQTYNPKTRDKQKELTCYDKEGMLLPENNQVVNLTTRYKWSGCKLEEFLGENWYRCKGGRTFSSSRERWWYIVVSNCPSEQGLYLNYSITMTNSLDENDVFFKHFSADEFYILQETIAFILVYLLLLVLSIYVAYSLHLRQLYHTTYKLYMASMCLEFLALLAQLIYWTSYGIKGSSSLSWKNLGQFLEYCGQALFLILLILMGKGYTITRGRISTSGVVKIIVFSIIYVVATIAMYAWEFAAFDPGLVLYIYDSVPGYCLIGLKIASWLWFIYGIAFTLKHYPEKVVFYVPFLVLYTIWFWCGTAVALAAIDTIPKWMKEKIVQGCFLAAIFLGHIIFLILTWPTLANKTFPYHIKTTQVGAMIVSNSTPNTAPNSNGEAGGAYTPSNQQSAYEPIGESQFINMFTTSHTQSNGVNRTQIVNPDKFPHQSTA